MSVLFPELASAVVNRVLREGTLISGEDEAAMQAAATLSELGIIAITPRRYVRCAYRLDPDYEKREELDCEGEIDIDQSTFGLACPMCGQPVYDIRQKEVFTEDRVQFNISGCKRYIRRVLLNLNLVDTITDEAGGAFKVELVDGRPLPLSLLDEAERGDINTFYIRVSSLPRPDIGGLSIFELALFLSLPPAQAVEHWREKTESFLLTVEQRRLLNVLVERFSYEEFDGLCFELKIDPEELQGEVKRAKARELIKRLERTNRLSELAALIQQKRPDVTLIPPDSSGTGASRPSGMI